jgi:tetratricopeptide (TPR) repeat protein
MGSRSATLEENMPSRRWYLVVSWCGVLLLLPLVARVPGAWARCSAQAQEAESSAYREAIEQALAEYGSKNYEEASTLFGRADKLYPNARTQRGMGMAAFELRRYAESIGYLEAALASTVKPLDAALRSETEALLGRARGFVAAVTVDVEPRGAELLLDGNRVEAFTRLTIELGEHVFEARLAGHVTERRVVHLHGGEVLPVRMMLAVERAEPVAQQHQDKPRPLYKNAWLWTGVGAAVVGAVVAGVVVATRKGDQTKIEPSGTDHTPPGVSLSTLGSR